MGRELFGTDGVRGIAGEYPLDDAGARAIGRAVGTHFAQPGESVVVGCDPRESSAGLVAAVTEGLVSVGVHAVQAGVLPTPGLAYVTGRHEEFVAGIMITASHNPYQYNGIKVFNADGGKLPDETETILNTLTVDGVADRGQGSISEAVDLAGQYEDFLVASVPDMDLNGMPLVIDMANGAATGLGERVFTRLGAAVKPLSDNPDGRNINEQCGATDTASLAQSVTDTGAALGAAFDGDADRLIMIDNLGREVKGDYLLYILAVSSGVKGVVATVMSNMGFELALRRKGIALERTAVGDRYVLEGLERTGYRLGGEESGHIILPELLSTGDGLLAAVHVLKALKESGRTLAEWCDEVELLPQAMVNITVSDKSALDRSEAQAYIREQTETLSDTGRLLVRASGTEPLVRVMVEAPDAEARARSIAGRLEELLA